MSLPTARLPHVTSGAVTRSSTAPATPTVSGDSFAAEVDRAAGIPPDSATSKSVRGFRDLPGFGRIETVTITETKIGSDGKPVNHVKELAVCPECGTINCPCMARVTVQNALDEENAKGPRDAEKPQSASVVPQTFNQLSLNFTAGQSRGLERNPQVTSSQRF